MSRRYLRSIPASSGQVQSPLAMYSSISMPRFKLLASLFLGFTGAQTAYESIYTLSAFSVQQNCVQSCFTKGYTYNDCYTDVLGSVLGCPNSPCSSTFAAVDDCYCRGDLQTVAHDWLSMCIDQLCSVGDNSVNLAIATSIYLGYCTARGFTALRVQNTAETSSPSDFSTTTASTRSAPASATSTSLSDTTTPSLTSPSNTLTIALASVGAVAVIAILVAAISCWKIRRKKIRANPGPYNLGTWPTSTLQLRPSGESRLSGGVTDVTPSDSISQVDQPGMMGPSYPQYSDPSTISTNYRGYGASTVGPGRSVPRY